MRITKHAALAATILLVPGGTILGGVLLIRQFRNRAIRVKKAKDSK